MLSYRSLKYHVHGEIQHDFTKVKEFNIKFEILDGIYI